MKTSAPCTRCGGRLYFACRERGNGLCSPCHRVVNGLMSPADVERMAVTLRPIVHNLAIAGALCASYALGDNPPTEWRALGDGYVPVPWHPGCGRSAK